jgi:hypothetical protein
MASDGSGAGGKIGRNKAKCEKYRAQDRRAKNKARRQARILKGFRDKEES